MSLVSVRICKRLIKIPLRLILEKRSAHSFILGGNVFSENSAMDSLKHKRKPYRDESNVFTEDQVNKDPIVQFKQWLDEAMETPGIEEANAMCLATANRNCVPSARYILLKGFGANGFEFFTNYESRKGQDLEENPQAALTFYWAPLNRSVRIEGHVEKVDEAVSTEYFHDRPVNSQVSASVSKQSSVVPSREHMKEQMKQFAKEVAGGVVPKPKYWGGYRVIPESIEFWQGQSDRLHDRIKFRKLKGDEVIDNTITHMGIDGWVYERLYP